ncbi:MAG TPA: major capsid protein [Trueperaceae bacterium]
MASTKISDIIVPEVFNPYVIERTAQMSALWRSGIVRNDPTLDALASSGGTILNMPFFQDLTGDDEVLSDSSALTPGNIKAAQDQARLHMRGRAWGVNDLAEALSGDDPMRAIGDLVAEYWARRYQALLISTLTGVFADNETNDGGDLVHDISTEDGDNATDANFISAEAIIDAAQKLGDAKGNLVAISMHSVPHARLQKNDLVDDVPDSQANIGFGTYLQKTLIVDDSHPVVAGSTSGFKYTTYLFGAGAIGFGQGRAPVPTETDRDSLAGEDYLINRNHFILHPRGIKWVEGTIAGASPTNTELESATHWDRVYERKNIRIVKLVTNG